MRTIDSYFTREPNIIGTNHADLEHNYVDLDNKYVDEDVSLTKLMENKVDTIINNIDNTDNTFLFTPECEEKSKCEEHIIRVYTDGACSKNGSQDAKAGLGIFFGEGDPRNTSKRIEGKQTNNTAELKAIIATYKILQKEIEQGIQIRICSDSEYSIKCCTTYGEKCSKNGWKNKKGPIPNLELVKEAYILFKGKKNIKFVKVEAHTGRKDRDSIGNDWADRLASKSIGVSNRSTGIIGKGGGKGEGPISKIYLKIPFDKKNLIKGIGGKWDPVKKKWYMMKDVYESKSDLLDSILGYN